MPAGLKNHDLVVGHKLTKLSHTQREGQYDLLLLFLTSLPLDDEPPLAASDFASAFSFTTPFLSNECGLSFGAMCGYNSLSFVLSEWFFMLFGCASSYLCYVG